VPTFEPLKKLAGFMGFSPDKATEEDIRKFQLHLVETGTSRVTINATIVGLRFFFEVTVGTPQVIGKLKFVTYSGSAE
jgi:integrase/recombinase XerD